MNHFVTCGGNGVRRRSSVRPGMAIVGWQAKKAGERGQGLTGAMLL